MIIIFKKYITLFALAIFFSVQVLTAFSALLLPKQAEAFGPSVTVIDIPRTIFQIADAAGRRIASNVADKFLTKFIDQLDQKYKIRNYLYYDQVLTDYYLSNYIQDKIDDPDLRQIYSLYHATLISGKDTGLAGQPNPNNAILAKLKTAIAKKYESMGGIPTSVIDNPPADMSNLEYYSAAQNWSLNPPSYTEQNLRAEYGALQSEATTASQLEVIVGGSYKAGRVIGGTCKAPVPYDSTKYKTPSDCQAVGGTWQASTLDQLRGLIDNPAGKIKSWLDSAIKQQLSNNFSPSEFNSVIGSLLGNFLFNKLLSGTSSPVIQESSLATYTPTDPNAGITQGKELDIDGDNVFDGMDYDADGLLDICYYGGIQDPVTGNSSAGPPCQGSIQALTAQNGTAGGGLTCADVPTALACNAPNHQALVENVKAYVVAQGISTAGNCGAFEIVKRVAWALRGEGVGLMTTFHTTQCNGFSADVIAYTDGSGVDILSDGGGANIPAWQPGPDNPEVGVDFAQATDPGDPPGSY